MVNIYNGSFLQKQLMAKNYKLFLHKSSIIDVRLVSKYASTSDEITYRADKVENFHVYFFCSFHHFITFRQNLWRKIYRRLLNVYSNVHSNLHPASSDKTMSNMSQKFVAFKTSLTNEILRASSQYLSILAQCCISIPAENVRKPRFSDVFRGYRNGTLG